MDKKTTHDMRAALNGLDKVREQQATISRLEHTVAHYTEIIEGLGDIHCARVFREEPEVYFEDIGWRLGVSRRGSEAFCDDQPDPGASQSGGVDGSLVHPSLLKSIGITV
jgi:hypothetical protein